MKDTNLMKKSNECKINIVISLIEVWTKLCSLYTA
jgi:hypothetical protein